MLFLTKYQPVVFLKHPSVWTVTKICKTKPFLSNAKYVRFKFCRALIINYEVSFQPRCELIQHHSFPHMCTHHPLLSTVRLADTMKKCFYMSTSRAWNKTKWGFILRATCFVLEACWDLTGDGCQREQSYFIPEKKNHKKSTSSAKTSRV